MILITGGLGYIGSHLAIELLNDHKEIVILDNLSTSDISTLDNIELITHKRLIFYQGCISDTDLLQKIISNHNITAVIHLAAFKSINEGELYPDKYWDNNVIKSKIFFDFIINTNIKNIIFSSTASVYETSDELLTENSLINPVSVYGKTKLEIEKYLEQLHSYGLINVTILRYFNPIGVHSSGLLKDTGLDNLYPNIQKALKAGVKFNVYGNDYSTPDGTAIRDYINIIDLVKYHILFLNSTGFQIFNVGTGVGKSVLEILKEFPEVQYQIKSRRSGDVPKLVCSIDKLRLWELEQH